MDKCLTCTGFIAGADLFIDPERCFECVTEDFPDRYEKQETTEQNQKEEQK